jgi:hypothetical protein
MIRENNMSISAIQNQFSQNVNSNTDFDSALGKTSQSNDIKSQNFFGFHRTYRGNFANTANITQDNRITGKSIPLTDDMPRTYDTFTKRNYPSFETDTQVMTNFQPEGIKFHLPGKDGNPIIPGKDTLAIGLLVGGALTVTGLLAHDKIEKDKYEKENNDNGKNKEILEYVNSLPDDKQDSAREWLLDGKTDEEINSPPDAPRSFLLPE